MYKRGQVTIFIILGIIVIAILAWLFFLGNLTFGEELTQEEAQVFVSTRIEPLKNYVESCVEESAFVVLGTMGQYGGEVVPRIDESNPRFDFLVPTGDHVSINYVAYNQNNEYVNKFLSVSEMENEFENYLENVALHKDNPEGFSDCINNFEPFKNSFDKIEDGDLDTEVEFARTIRIKVTYPVKITKSSYETTINEFFVEIPINMNELRSVGSMLINDVIAGNNIILTREYLVDKYTNEISAGLREDSVSFDYFTTYSSPTPYNNRNNYFFTLKYEHPELSQAYIFNMLVGEG